MGALVDGGVVVVDGGVVVVVVVVVKCDCFCLLFYFCNFYL